MNEVKPLFKYIGGKTWLKNKLREKFEFILSKGLTNAYCEPFAGGLGAFINVYDILLKHNIKNIYLNDINKQLISVYQNILLNKQNLIEEILKIEKEFEKTIPKIIKKIDKEDLKLSEQYFKNKRIEFNNNKSSGKIADIKLNALLVFLQRHSFNGIYRENSKGQYNTPFNWSANQFNEKEIIKRIEDIYNVFVKFENIQFSSKSFEDISYNKDTLYYLDPPYLNEDIVENNYHQETFNLKKQILLIEKILDYNFIYSNHFSQTLLKEFEKSLYLWDFEKINRKNNISSNSDTRNKEKFEILLTHYNLLK